MHRDALDFEYNRMLKQVVDAQNVHWYLTDIMQLLFHLMLAMQSAYGFDSKNLHDYISIMLKSVDLPFCLGQDIRSAGRQGRDD